MAALKYPFNRPSPWTNLLLIGVCTLIPIVGPIVVMGYGISLEKALVMDLHGEPGRFEFNRFTHYLERGVIPFVVSLVLGFVLLPFILAVQAVCYIAIFVFHASPGAIAAAVIAAFLAFFVVSMIFNIFTIGFVVRASLEGEFASAFNFAWAFDFVKRVGWTAVGYLFLMQLIAFPLILAGLCALYVGIFFSTAYISFVWWHLQMQLYHLYLDRGGTPLAIKPEPPPPAFPVVMP